MSLTLTGVGGPESVTYTYGPVFLTDVFLTDVFTRDVFAM